jgi:peptidoglycan/LPS O-acetylase OafA/YrhL
MAHALPKLRALNAIRVFAEYLVVRAHVVDTKYVSNESGSFDEGAHGVIGMDIMSFFFVLSGFVMMYTFEQADFSSWSAIRKFWWGRWWRVYPMFLFNWLCWLPHVIRQLGGMSGSIDCWVNDVCPILQLFMLDSWAGCGYLFVANGLSWYLSCLAWLWLLFPLIKDRLVRWFSSGHLWEKVAGINLAYACVFLLLWEYDIYTLCAVPALRLGEFVMGCGAALALRTNDNPALLADGAYWIWFAMVICTYCLERVDHGISFICLHEEAQHKECTLWHAGQKWVKNRPPCITTMEKILNKYALVWAGLIYGVARAEIEGSGLPFLQADIFKLLSTFSLALYLGHQNMFMAIKWLGLALVGWEPGQWRDDTMLLFVYVLCYGLHHLMIRLFTSLSSLFSLSSSCLNNDNGCQDTTVYTVVNQDFYEERKEHTLVNENEKSDPPGMVLGVNPSIFQ